MRGLALAVPATLMANGLAAQQPTSCAVRQPTLDFLQGLARQYHPEALQPDRSSDSLLVVFIMDAQCRVLDHATSRRQGEGIDLEATLTSLFPAARIPASVRMAGIVEALRAPGPGTPWVVWAVIRT